MMLNDLSEFKHIYIACGYIDLRCGIDGLAGIVKHKFELDPVAEESIFLFLQEADRQDKGSLV